MQTQLVPDQAQGLQGLFRQIELCLEHTALALHAKGAGKFGIESVKMRTGNEDFLQVELEVSRGGIRRSLEVRLHIHKARRHGRHEGPVFRQVHAREQEMALQAGRRKRAFQFEPPRRKDIHRKGRDVYGRSAVGRLHRRAEGKACRLPLGQTEKQGFEAGFQLFQRDAAGLPAGQHIAFKAAFALQGHVQRREAAPGGERHIGQHGLVGLQFLEAQFKRTFGLAP